MVRDLAHLKCASEFSELMFSQARRAMRLAYQPSLMGSKLRNLSSLHHSPVVNCGARDGQCTIMHPNEVPMHE